MSVLAALLLPTLSLVWPFSPVVLLSSLLACGSSPLVIPLVQLASYLGYFSFLHNRLTVLEYSAFTSYGAFWLSFATLLIPGSGVAAAYAASTDPAQEVDAIAIYLITWMVVTFLFFIGSLRKSIGLTVLFFCLTITFLLLAVADFSKNDTIGKTGGGLGVVTALVAYYCGLSELLTDDDIFTIPLGKYPPKSA
jgi:succinate-acetate transporter protein